MVIATDKKFIDMLDQQILLSQQFLYKVEQDKGSGKIKEGTANILIAAQMIVLQSSILISQALKETKDET